MIIGKLLAPGANEIELDDDVMVKSELADEDGRDEGERCESLGERLLDAATVANGADARISIVRVISDNDCDASEFRGFDKTRRCFIPIRFSLLQNEVPPSR